MAKENKIKIGFTKLILILVGIALLYSVISDLYKISYLEFKGVETTGKLITFDEKITSGRRKFKSYTPIVRIKIDGQEIDVPATLNKIDKDLVDFVGDEVKVKYSSKDYKLLIINEKKYLLKRINDIILVLQFSLFFFLAGGTKATYGEDGKLKWIPKKKNAVLDLILWSPGLLSSFLWIYYQIILGKYAIEQFDFLGALGTFMFLLVYTFIAISFIENKKTSARILNKTI
ncbi:hypothetical protein QYB59_001747 [Clostridium perfringens]|nr:hypothetical protein [Clostridium perfringens]